MSDKPTVVRTELGGGRILITDGLCRIVLTTADDPWLDAPLTDEEKWRFVQAECGPLLCLDCLANPCTCTKGAA